MRLLIAFVMFYSLTALARPLTDQERKEFIDEGMPSCVQKQKNESQLTNSQIINYCHCYFSRVADQVSYEDFQNYNGNVIAAAAQEAGQYCSNTL